MTRDLTDRDFEDAIAAWAADHIKPNKLSHFIGIACRNFRDSTAPEHHDIILPILRTRYSFEALTAAKGIRLYEEVELGG